MGIKVTVQVKAQPWSGNTGAGEVHTFNGEFVLPDGADAHTFGECAGPVMDALYAKLFGAFGIEAAATIEEPAASVEVEADPEAEVKTPAAVQDTAGG